jgi:DNA-directed RNA polymerase alpha subunit
MLIQFVTESLPIETQRALYLELKRKFEHPSALDIPLAGEELLDADVYDLTFFDRHVCSLLKSAKIQTIRELTTYSEYDLRKIRGFGDVCMRKVKAFLQAHQLSLSLD